MATSKVLKPRRGSTAEHATFKGQAFEITFDTDKKTVVAHDGLTMGGFPLAHEAAVATVDGELRTLIDQKISDLEGVSSSELTALDTALRSLININAQQQAARDSAQDDALTALNDALRTLIAEEVAKAMAAASSAQNTAEEAQSSADAAQSSADAKLPLVGGQLTGPLTGTSYTQKLSQIDVTATPDASIYDTPILFRDKNDKFFAMLQPVQGSNGANMLRLIVAKKDGSQGGIVSIEQMSDGQLRFTAGGKVVVSITESSWNFIRFTNGLQIVFDNVNIPANANSTTYSFPRAFVTTDKLRVMITDTSGATSYTANSRVFSTFNKKTTSIGVGVDGKISSVDAVDLVAIGYWK